MLNLTSDAIESSISFFSDSSSNCIQNGRVFFVEKPFHLNPMSRLMGWRQLLRVAFFFDGNSNISRRADNLLP